jgi:hypothetical protein
MFTIFEDENEPMSERAKVDELLTKVQHTSLAAAVAQLRFQLNTEGVTFTVAANHLNSAVSQTQEFQIARKVASTSTNERHHGDRGGRGSGRFGSRSGRGRAGRGRGGYAGRGSYGEKSGKSALNTKYYSPSEWDKLSFEQRDKIRKERDKRGEQGGSKRSIGDLSVEQFTAIISAVNSDHLKVATTETTDHNSSGSAGNAFGGKEAAKRARSLAAHRTSNRRIAKIHVPATNLDPVFARCELDTHADTCALGRNFTPLSFTGRVCDVSPYSSEHYESQRNVPIIAGATAYTSQETGQTYILVVNEGLWLGPNMKNSLLNPNQMRYNGVTVHDNPFDSHHELSIEHDDVTLPLTVSRTNIFLDTRTPTQHELDNCPHVHLTCETKWNPQTVRFASIQSVEAQINDNSLDELDPGLSQI